MNHKRMQRLWREEGLQRPISRKGKRARAADGSVRRHRAEQPHQVWAMAFQFDATADGRRLKFLNVIDKHSRLCLAIRVGRRCKATDVVAVLEELTSVYPAPTFIRSEPWAGIHRSGSTGLVRCQRHHQRRPHRAGIPIGERLCRNVQQRVEGRVPQH